MAARLERCGRVRTLRLLLHITLAGLTVFVSALTAVVQLENSELSVLGLVLVVLLGAWAGASSMLRTWGSLMGAGVAATTLLVLALDGRSFNHYVNLFLIAMYLPLVMSLWAVVAWRHGADDEAPAPG
jgi:hypothetical protein